ncbi:MAG: DUF4339 domain-containing protein [Planctomycetota bacterium]|nr:DUF4339 domain-containing protein [Planctomycetota bacterium]
MSDAPWFVSPDGRTRFGPYTDADLRTMIAERRLLAASLVWRDGLPAWAPLSTIPDFQPDLARAPDSGLPTDVRMPIPPGELAPAPRSSSSITTLLVVGGALGGLCLILALLAAILLPALGKARSSARQIKDSTHIRGIHQGMVLWAQNNNDIYPLPSRIDRANATLAPGEPKDLPRHITSILIYNGFFSPELCVSPAESNPAFAIYPNYSYSTPPTAAAADKRLALWDPAFRALPMEYKSDSSADPGQGAFSYAYMPPVGRRLAKWSNTFRATEAALGNRGPAYNAVGSGATLSWILVPDQGPSADGSTEVGINSNTLLIHGGRSTWEGNICYNDNRVVFETDPAPIQARFSFSGLPVDLRTQPDNLFVDENDASRAKDSSTGVNSANSNILLRNWYGGDFDPDTGKLLDIPDHLWFD